MYYVVAENQIRRGRVDAYARAIFELAARSERATRVSVYAAQDVDDLALTVLRFRDEEEYRAAHTRLLPIDREQIRQHVVSGTGLQGFVPIYQFERVFEPAEIVLARRLVVSADQTDAFLDVARAVRELVVQLDGTVALQILRNDTHPSEFLSLTEFRDQAGYDAARRLAHGVDHFERFYAPRRRFIGQSRGHWVGASAATT